MCCVLSMQALEPAKEGANKSIVFSAGNRTATCEEDCAAKCLDLFKRSDKADGRSSARPLGLSEKQGIGVNNFCPAGVPEATSMPVISVPFGYVALISCFSESQYPKGMIRRKGLIRTFPNKSQRVGIIMPFEYKSIYCLTEKASDLFSGSLAERLKGGFYLKPDLIDLLHNSVNSSLFSFYTLPARAPDLL